MSTQFWIWLAIVVISLIARAIKNKPAVEEEEPRPSQDRFPSKPDFNPKPMTFEELLKEIQSTKTSAPAPAPAKTTDFVDYDDNLEEEEQDLEKKVYDYRSEDQIYETYEKAKKEAFYKPSLEETLKLEDTVVKFGQFKGYQQVGQWVPTTNYAREFRNPESFKKAFIMSEILKRKF